MSFGALVAYASFRKERAERCQRNGRFVFMFSFTDTPVLREMATNQIRQVSHTVHSINRFQKTNRQVNHMLQLVFVCINYSLFYIMDAAYLHCVM